MVTLDFDKFDGNNYAMWAVNMKSYLILKELWSAVTAVDLSPAGVASNQKAMAQLVLHVKEQYKPIQLSEARLQVRYSMPSFPVNAYKLLIIAKRQHCSTELQLP